MLQRSGYGEVETISGNKRGREEEIFEEVDLCLPL